MTNLVPAGKTNRKTDSIIELAGCSDHDRILLAGAGDSDPVSGWRRRGYHRVATIAASRLPRGQYDVAVVEWRQHSIRALETMLDWLVCFRRREADRGRFRRGIGAPGPAGGGRAARLPCPRRQTLSGRLCRFSIPVRCRPPVDGGESARSAA
jgi:hypothetical protein